MTKAVLKLSQQPRQRFTALLAVRSESGLIELAQKLRMEAGEFLTALEFFSDIGLGIALKNIPGLFFCYRVEHHFVYSLKLALDQCRCRLIKL